MTDRGGRARRALENATILGVFAHPDDESLACGGTLARLADEGVRVVLICASKGERGAAGPERDDAIGLARVRELGRAASILGASEVTVLDHPDGELRWVRITEFQADLAMSLRRYRPAAVITFGSDGLYWHQDHVGVHEQTTAAVRALGAAAPALYYVTMRQGAMRGIVDNAAARGWTAPRTGFWSLPPDAFGADAEPPTTVIDVERWVERKLDAIRSHQTPLGPNDPFSALGAADARRWLGRECFHRAADAGPGRVLEPLGETG